MRKMAKTFRVAAAVVIMPLLAIAAALASLSTVLTVALPDRAAALPIVDGDAFARRTLDQLGDLESPGQNLQQAAALDGARTFNAEPTNSAAVGLMALSRQLKGDLPAARTLYEDALAISTRDKVANLWLMEDATAQGRIGFILDRYDLLLRTGGAASDTLFDVLGTALQEDVIVPHLEQRLARRPPWAEQFWLRVAPRGAAIANIGRLRLRLENRAIGNPANNDDEIIRRLIDGGEIDIASGLYRRLAPHANKPGTLVRNAEFTQRPMFPPFDWETFAGATFGAEIDPKAGVLALFSEEGVDTLVARQLLTASAGRYRLVYQLRNPGALVALRPTLRVHCSGSGEAPLASTVINAATGDATVRVPALSCQDVWVEIWVRKISAGPRAGDDLLIDSVKAQRVQ